MGRVNHATKHKQVTRENRFFFFFFFFFCVGCMEGAKTPKYANMADFLPFFFFLMGKGESGGSYCHSLQQITSQCLIHIIAWSTIFQSDKKDFMFTLRGYCTSNLRLACLVHYVKIINTFQKIMYLELSKKVKKALTF